LPPKNSYNIVARKYLNAPEKPIDWAST